jgi:hypothetical protein
MSQSWGYAAQYASDARTTDHTTLLLGANAMKKMMQMAMVAGAMFMVVTTVAQAQGGEQQGGRRGGGRPNVVSILKDSLHVSDAVAAKADSIQKAYATLNAPLMEAMRGGDADARTKIGENRAKQMTDIKALLTDDQKAALDKIMAAIPQGRRGGGGR